MKDESIVIGSRCKPLTERVMQSATDGYARPQKNTVKEVCEVEVREVDCLFIV